MKEKIRLREVRVTVENQLNCLRLPRVSNPFIRKSPNRVIPWLPFCQISKINKMSPFIK